MIVFDSLRGMRNFQNYEILTKLHENEVVKILRSKLSTTTDNLPCHKLFITL